MPEHRIVIFDKKIKYTENSMFRVEESKNPKACYEGVYAHKDPIRAIAYYTHYESLNGSVFNQTSGKRIRLVKDGDEFKVIAKKVL